MRETSFREWDGVLLSDSPQTDIPICVASVRRRLGLQDDRSALTMGVAICGAGSPLQDSIATRNNIVCLTGRRES
jgi:hypothetical protein